MRRRRTNPRKPVKCEVCPRMTATPRKGMCWACYFRDYRGHHVRGPCAVCGDDDARLLRRHTLADGATVLCANHAAIAGRRKLTAAELAAECYPTGDRRRGGRRRGDRRSAIARRQRHGDAWLLGEALDRRGELARRADD